MIPSPTNTQLFLNINHFAQQTDWLHAPMQFMAKDGILLFGILLVWGWLYSRRRDTPHMAALVWTGLGTLLAVALNQPLVQHFHEARPYTSLQHILVLAHRSTDYGFPSDHATMAGAVTAGLFLVNPFLGFIALIISLLLAFSRVYIAAHYPFDVLSGLVVGAAVMLISYALIRKPLIFILTKLAGTPLRPLITTHPAAGSQE